MDLVDGLHLVHALGLLGLGALPGGGCKGGLEGMYGMVGLVSWIGYLGSFKGGRVGSMKEEGREAHNKPPASHSHSFPLPLSLSRTHLAPRLALRVLALLGEGQHICWVG